MKTNRYLEQYMNAQNQQRNGKDLENSLSWHGGLGGDQISITPEHFNYFYFSVNARENSTLTIENARELANWLLEKTEGLENVHGVISEIIKRR